MLLFVVQVIVVVYGLRTSFTLRIVTSFIGLAFFLIAVPFMANAGGGFAFWSVFGLCMVYGVFDGCVLTTIFQMGGAFPPKYIAAIMIG